MSGTRQWLLGIAIALGGHLVAVPLGTAVVAAFPNWYRLQGTLIVALFLPGLTQLLWVVPAAIVAAVRGHKRVVWGMLVTAGIVFLLNTACFGLAFGEGMLR